MPRHLLRIVVQCMSWCRQPLTLAAIAKPSPPPTSRTICFSDRQPPRCHHPVSQHACERCPAGRPVSWEGAPSHPVHEPAPHRPYHLAPAAPPHSAPQWPAPHAACPPSPPARPRSASDVSHSRRGRRPRASVAHLLFVHGEHGLNALAGLGLAAGHLFGLCRCLHLTRQFLRQAEQVSATEPSPAPAIHHSVSKPGAAPQWSGLAPPPLSVQLPAST